MEKIKVLLVEDDPVWVKAMTDFLNAQEDMIIIGVAINKAEAIKMVQSLKIDIVLMDINLTENKYDGIYAAAEIEKIDSEIKIVMLTSLSEEIAVIKSFTAGAKQYISKVEYKEIPNAIRSVFSRNSPMDILLKDYSRLKEQEQLKELNFTEREVFDLIEKGYTRAQIQERLSKSESTLKKQIKQILVKLGVRSSKEAVQKVKRKGL